MNCGDYQKLISASIDNELSTSEQAMLSEHLKVCSECRQFAEDLEKINTGLLKFDQEMLSSKSERYILSKAGLHSREDVNEIRLLRGHYAIPKKLAWVAVILLFLLSFNTAKHLFESPLVEEKYSVPSVSTEESRNIVLTESDCVNSYTFYTRSINLKELEKL
jgi:hypothetical protein